MKTLGVMKVVEPPANDWSTIGPDSRSQPDLLDWLSFKSTTIYELAVRATEPAETGSPKFQASLTMLLAT